MLNLFSSLEIPYRLETAEDINRVMNNDLAALDTDFKRLITLSRTTNLCHPPAFIHAKKRVTKDFIKIRAEKIQDAQISYHQVANLSFIDQYPLVRNSIQWVHEIICHENLFQFIHTLPMEISKKCLVKSILGLPDSEIFGDEYMGMALLSLASCDIVFLVCPIPTTISIDNN